MSEQTGRVSRSPRLLWAFMADALVYLARGDTRNPVPSDETISESIVVHFDLCSRLRRVPAFFIAVKLFCYNCGGRSEEDRNLRSVLG